MTWTSFSNGQDVASNFRAIFIRWNWPNGLPHPLNISVTREICTCARTLRRLSRGNFSSLISSSLHMHERTNVMNDQLGELDKYSNMYHIRYVSPIGISRWKTILLLSKVNVRNVFPRPAHLSLSYFIDINENICNLYAAWMKEK